MINKILLFALCVAIGVLIYGWYHNHSSIVANEQNKIQNFINAGARFTADDGKLLCERVRKLEQHSYGFRDAGLIPLDCNYANR